MHHVMVSFQTRKKRRWWETRVQELLHLEDRKWVFFIWRSMAISTRPTSPIFFVCRSDAISTFAMFQDIIKVIRRTHRNTLTVFFDLESASRSLLHVPLFMLSQHRPLQKNVLLLEASNRIFYTDLSLDIFSRRTEKVYYPAFSYVLNVSSNKAMVRVSTKHKPHCIIYHV